VKKTDDSSSVGGNKSISGMLIGQVLEDVFAVRVFTTQHENCQNFFSQILRISKILTNATDAPTK